MSKKKDIWDKIRKDLQLKLPKSEFQTWFNPITLEKFDPDLAILRAPNKFVGNWITEKYLTEIKKSFVLVTKQTPSIYFTYDNSSKPQRGIPFYHTKDSEIYLTQRLNPCMTFECLVTGECNNFACSSALEVAKHSANPYNPLYIYSSPGLGKTHLLNAIGNYRVAWDPKCRVKYLSADIFSSDLKYAIKSERVHEFREEYGNLDLFLFDDIHLLEYRGKTQEEFLFIFNRLHENQKQIVITATDSPNNLKNINPKLKSRLGWGLISELLPPDTAMRIKILKRRLKEDHINIPDDVLFFLANYSTDIKILIKNIIKIGSYTSISDSNINLSVVKSLIKDKYETEISISNIKAITATYFNVSIKDLISNKRKRVYTYPRQVSMYLTRKYTSLPLKEIGRAFGYKDHSTVIYALRQIERRKSKEKVILDDLARIENLLI